MESDLLVFCIIDKHFTMESSDQLNECESDQDNDASHQRLLESIGVEQSESMDNKNGMRNEASQDVSVYTLSAMPAANESTSKTKLKLFELLKGVDESAGINNLKKQVNRVHRSTQQLDAPLSIPVSERLQRQVEYKKVSEKLGKWDPLVHTNRRAEHLSFPRQQEPLSIKTVDQFLSKSKKLTPLEEEIYALLRGNAYAERPDHDLSVREEELLASVSVEEAIARRSELQKHRALLSYHEAKMKRQKKIKSKKYNRLLRKKKQKESVANEAAGGSDNVQQADRLRAEERASLRHRMGSKWARSRAILAKSDSNYKDLLNEQLQKHKVLMVKNAVEEDNDREEEENHEPVLANSCQGLLEDLSQTTNPWLKPDGSRANANRDLNDNKITSDPNDRTSNGLDSHSTYKNDESRTKQDISSTDQSANASAAESVASLRDWLASSTSSRSDEPSIELKAKETETVRMFRETYEILKAQMLRERSEFDEPVKSSEPRAEESEEGLALSCGSETLPDVTGGVREAKPQQRLANGRNAKVDVDASKAFAAEVAPVSRGKNIFVENESDDAQRITIEQAFADDDVIAEFARAKRRVVDEDKPQDINLALPGWGEWGGAGVKLSKRKKRRFRVKAPPAPLRSDRSLGHVILNEKRDARIAQHQVDSLPFPFTSQEQFERTIARPIGETWNTPSTFQNFIKPKVSTVIGAVIPPMHSDEALDELKEVGVKRKSKRKAPSAKNKRIQQHENKLRKLEVVTS